MEAALELPGGARVLDVGTGSGAVALALKHERPDLTWSATDVSARRARRSRAPTRARLGLDVALARGDLLGRARATVDAVVANPPYVARAARALAPEIARHEPRGGARRRARTGSTSIRRLVPRAAAAGVPWVALEVGAGQADAVAELLRAAGYARVEARRDLAGIARVVVGPARDAASDAETFERCMAVGGVAVFPADTVYGLACDARRGGGRRAPLRAQGPRRRTSPRR